MANKKQREEVMEVFYHNIYEYQKGLRNLSLCTLDKKNRQKIEQRLNKEKISYVIHDITDVKINVYFGSKASVAVIQSFNQISLNKLTPEEDFILGIMLGYDRLMQCDRYLKRRYLAQKAS